MTADLSRGRRDDAPPEFMPPPCDYPVCIGGECFYDCEREDRSREYFESENAARHSTQERHDD